MPYYVHKKAIRLPITEYMIWKMGFDDVEDFIENFDYLISKNYPKLCYAGGKTPYFEVAITDKRPYIDLVLYYSCGEEYGDWATAKYLTKKEERFFTPYFNDGLDVPFHPNDFRKVDYCWYHCSKPTDCYEVNEEDDWTTLIGKGGY